MTKLACLAAAAALLVSTAATAQAPAKPLFASDQPIRFTLTGPIAQIAQTAQRSRDARAGTLSMAGAPDTLPVLLSPRGITRLKRETCQFPPLRVRFQARHRRRLCSPASVSSSWSRTAARRLPSRSICCSNMRPTGCTMC